MKYFVFSIKLIIILSVFGILNTRYQIPDTAYAEGVSLEIQPSNLQIRANSPADVRAPLTLTNMSEDSVTLTILLKRFRDAGDETGTIIYSNPKLITEASTDNFLKNVQVVDENTAVTQLTLGPKQKKNLVLQVNLLQYPDSSPAQDHYFSVVFLSNASLEAPSVGDEEQTTVSNIQTGISLPILFSLNQTPSKNTILDEFSGPLVLESGPVPFTIRVKNTGDHFVQAHGVIMIKNMFGQTVGKIDLAKTNILSGSTKSLSSDLSKGIFATENPKSKTVWSEKFLLGFYTATITLSTSPDQSLYTRSIHFVAFPLIGFGVLFLIILFGIFIVRRVRQKLSQ